MTDATASLNDRLQASTGSPVENRYMPLLIFLFVASGCAALIYEIVWFQLLSLNLGSSSISLGVLLGTFMGGMCLGSLLLPKYVSKTEHPLRVYAKIEIGIAIFGLVVLFIYPLIGGVYTTIGGPGMTGIFVRAIIAAICLLPPTILMGATLPAIARWVESTPKGVAWLGFFYGGNIAGAVLGCLLAGFYLLRVYDITVATFVAVALNLVIAAVAWGLANNTAHAPSQSYPDTNKGQSLLVPGAWPVYLTIMLSGLTALGSEVIWARLLSLLLGGTTYTFSLILAGFLIGLGIGSTVGASMARSISNPRVALGVCQMLVMVGIAWAAYALTTGLPNWPVNPDLTVSPFYNFQLDFMRCIFVVLPGALVWGASFPLALASIATDKQDPGRLVGTVYAANTVGAILGAMFASLIGIAWLGTKGAQQLMILFAAVSALLMLTTLVTGAERRLKLSPSAPYWAVITVLLAAFLYSTVNPVPALLVGHGRYVATWLGSAQEFVDVREGMNSSMAISREPNGELNYHNAGKVQASSLPQDMSLQRMLGHLTTLLVEKPDQVLVIACGAGVTAGAVSIDPRVQRTTIVEIEPEVPKVASQWFGAHNFNVVDNPKVDVVIDDGRHFLLTHKGKFDAITSDPFDPWVKGAATLYTKEFWQVARDKLNPGGVVTVFVQLYQAGMPAVKSEIKTFFEVFPNGLVFGNTFGGDGYDIVLVGMNDERPINVDAVEARLRSPEYAELARSLMDINVFSATDLFAKFAAVGPQLDAWLADGEINYDRNLRLQYLAGLGVNAYQQVEIYRQILSHRQFPEGVFAGSPETLMELRMKMLSQ